MADLLDGSITEFRFGVADESGCKSLTFGVTRSNDEIYLYCREFDAEKYSLHGSGQHHFAEIAKRAGGHGKVHVNTQLLRRNDGQFWTVARVLFTTTKKGWTNKTIKKKKNFYEIAPFDPSMVALVSLGFSSHHPASQRSTDHANHIAVMHAGENRYLTATLEIGPQNGRPSLGYHSALHVDDTIRSRIYEQRADVDQLLYLRSHLNTYILWAHHHTKDSSIDWVRYHPLGREMLRGQADLLSGKYVGDTLQQVLAKRSPDWRLQLATMSQAPAKSR